ncbi:MAG: hypothetical protein NZ455_07860 [Bacteroidia bacterium]|nr:hypothetical protein [Bacteroidia bacterium]
MGGWGAAPLARSTPTQAQRRDTPKKINISPSMALMAYSVREIASDTLFYL